MNIYVGNLPYSVTDADLRETFSQYGSVDRST
jgi:RNA recognition motif-containing protein